MIKHTLFALALLSVSAVCAQTKDGGISPQMLQNIKGTGSLSVSDKALANAMRNNSIELLARNFETTTLNDTHFSVETPKQSITNQKSSGRCWMFSGFNVLRASYTLDRDEAVEFSQTYLFVYDQLEKSNLFLQCMIDNAGKSMDDAHLQYILRSPIGDGGTFCGVADLVEKYGIVPKPVMPETYNSTNTSSIRRLITSKLREGAVQLRKMVAEGKKAKDLQAAKTEILTTIWRMLTMAYGTPPTEFTYQARDKKGDAIGEPKKYTPQQYFKEVCPNGLNGTFIMVMNDPRREYHKVYEVDLDRHTYEGHNWKYLNLPMEDIEAMAIAALKDNRKMYSSYDVGKFIDRKLGYCSLDNYDYGSLFGTTFTMDKAERIATFDSGSTHAMTLTAVDLNANGKPLKWKVENSWGDDSGQKGYLIMTADWFREYFFRLVVDNKYVPANLMKEWQQKPILVPAEDPVFSLDD
ncbi:MAG: C1 family peptidase [Bacteroidaceae bacterium]|nr:C1 family peptidase [Bacteroidaceae bacterium]